MSDVMSELFSNDPRLRRLHELVNDHPDFERVAAQRMDVYCFRYVPNGLADRQDEPEIQRLLDRLNQEIAAAIQRTGPASLMTTSIYGRIAMRMPNGPSATSTAEIDTTFEAIARWGRLLNKKLTVQNSRIPDMEATLCLSESHFSPTEL